ncbi:MAG: PaaI family thioesterase, partial [candidate division WOR-3 bacterium]
MLKDFDRCFACGRQNRNGLQLPIQQTTEGVKLSFVFDERFAGWAGIVHGGIVATVLDELLAWACRVAGHDAVTAELQVRFRQPLKVGHRFHGEGRIVDRRGRLLLGQSRLIGDHGELI